MKKLLFINYIQGISCLIFVSSQNKDYIDAVKYCTTVHNGVLCNLNTSMKARDTCRLHHSDVWYKREETDPQLGAIKPEGMCYVYGSYWRPCKDKLPFFCNDYNTNDTITCSAELPEPDDRIHLNIQIVTNNTNMTSDESQSNETQILFPTSKLFSVDLSLYQIFIFTGVAILSLIVSVLIVGLVTVCRRKKEQKTGGNDSSTSLRHSLEYHNLDNKWYETNRETVYLAQHIYDKTEPAIYDIAV